MPRLLQTLLIVLALATFSVKHTQAQTNLNVSLQVGDTTITLSGKTSPSAIVTISEDNAIVGTTSADSLGNFTKTLDSQNEGLHEFSIYATDTSSTVTAVTTVSLSAAAFENTSVSNIILPSTMYITNTNVDQGDPITLSGYGVPSSTIQVYISTVTGFSTTTSDSNGYWTYTIDTTNVSGGEHSVYVKVVTPSNYTSLSSTQTTISVDVPAADNEGDDDDEDDDNDNDEDSDNNDTIIETVTNLITDGLSKTEADETLLNILSYFDIDKSGKIEMSELELALRRWMLEAKGKGSGNCDLNFDGKCNIVDFSILLYYIDR